MYLYKKILHAGGAPQPIVIILEAAEKARAKREELDTQGERKRLRETKRVRVRKIEGIPHRVIGLERGREVYSGRQLVGM